MRVALVSLHSSPLELPATQNAGGMNVVVYELARTLTHAGHQVTLVVATESESRAVLPLPPGVQLRTVHVDAQGLAAEFGSTAHVQAVTALRLILRDHDVVHAHYWLSGTLCAEALQHYPEQLDAQPPLVVSLHTLGAEKSALGERDVTDIRIRAERELARTVPLLASSEAEAVAIQAYYGPTHAEIERVPPGVDLQQFRPGDTVRPNQLLVIGRLQPFKGQDFALEVFAALRRLRKPRAHRADLTLSFVGTETPGAEEFAQSLRDQAVALRLAGDVRFLGALSRAELAALLAESSITIIPSRSETYGMVALESAACGTPVIGQRIGGLTDSVSPGRSGLLLDSRDPERWAEALDQLLEHPEPLALMRRQARQFAEAHSWEQTAHRALSAYRQAIAAGR